MADVRRSLRILPFWWVLRWAWLGEAIWVIYLIEDRGLTIGEVLLFDAAYAAATVVAEVPTGIVADRYGRRVSMIAGSASFAAAFMVFGLAESMPLLMASYVMFGLGTALMSGTEDAYLFDSLRAVGRGDDFAAVAGRLNSLVVFATAGFTLAGAAMVVWTPLAWPIVARGGISALAVVFAWMLVEPPRAEERASFAATGTRAAGRIATTPALRWILPLFAVVHVSGTVVFVTFQPFVVDAGLPTWTLGGFAAALMLAGGAGAASAGRLGRQFGLRRTLAVLPMLAAVALLGGASGLIWLFPLFALSAFAYNGLQPLVSDYISRRVPDGERATALSYNQVSAQIAAILAMLALGVAADRVGLGWSLAGVSAALVLVSLAGFALWQRVGDLRLAPRE